MNKLLIYPCTEDVFPEKRVPGVRGNSAAKILFPHTCTRYTTPALSCWTFYNISLNVYTCVQFKYHRMFTYKMNFNKKKYKNNHSTDVIFWLLASKIVVFFFFFCKTYFILSIREYPGAITLCGTCRFIIIFFFLSRGTHVVDIRET